MTHDTLYDLTLVGYRNDLARARVVDHVRSHARRAPDLEITLESRLPMTVFTDLDHDLGMRLAATLRGLGAYVRLVANAPIEDEPIDFVVQPKLRWPYTSVFASVAAFALVMRFGMPDVVGPALPPGGADSSPASLRVLNDRAVELNSHGDYEEAADKLRRAVEMAPDQPVVRRNLVTVLKNLAVAELNAERPQQAIVIAEEALAVGGDESDQALSVIGMAHARSNDWDEARTALEEAIERGAEDANTLITLGNVYRQQGNREGAVEMFQRARESGVGESGFVRTLQRMERELDTEWDFSELSGSHFRVSFAEGENHDAAQIILSHLENVYYSVGAKLGHYPNEETSVVLYDKDEFHDITQTPSWAGGAYDGRIKLPVHGLRRDDPALDRTLRHEYAHVVIGHMSKGRAPVWLNEGTAIWAEEHRAGERYQWAARQVEGQHLFHLSELQRPFTQLPPDRVPVAYAQSYLAVHALTRRYGEQRLRDYLAALADAKSPDEAFAATFGTRIAEFESNLIGKLTS